MKEHEPQRLVRHRLSVLQHAEELTGNSADVGSGRVSPMPRQSRRHQPVLWHQPSPTPEDVSGLFGLLLSRESARGRTNLLELTVGGTGIRVFAIHRRNLGGGLHGGGS